MIKIGQHQELVVLRSTSVGLFLGDNLGNEVLLPNKYVPEGVEPEDTIEVFVYKDSEDRPIATTLKPKAIPGQFAVLTVNDVSGVGAFLDIGLEKDLLVPYREQNRNLSRDMDVLVYVYLDDVTQRMVATCKISKFLEKDISELSEGMQVDVLVGPRNDLGRSVIINNKYQGIIYENQIFEKLSQGDQRLAYIQKIREDEKIDVSLQPVGYENIDRFEQVVLDALEKNGGTLPIGDKSDPNKIYELLGMSKKNFKKAIGTLYKNRKVLLEPTSVKLV